MNLVAHLLEGLSGEQQPVLHARGDWLSTTELRDRVRRWTRELSELGTGQRVLLLSPNDPFWVVGYLATIASGNIAVPADTRLTPGDIDAVVARTRPALALVHSKLNRRIPAGLPCPILDESHEPGAAPGEPVDVDPDTQASIVFTSGSTGEPKGVVLSHGNLIANTDAIIEYLQLGPRDVIEVVLPLSYCFGTSLLHTHLRAGGRIVLNNKFFLTKSVIRDFEQLGCTGFAGVPSHFEMLIQNTDFLERTFPHLRYVAQAGGRMRPETIGRLMDKPGVDLFVMYGQTEATARLSFMPPARLRDKPGSIGRGLSNVELAILREDGTRAEVGEEGQIAACGPNVMLGYLDDPDATAAKVVDGWLLTGDLGHMDAEGDVFVTGRIDDMVKLGGFRSNLGVLRQKIAGLPGVRDVALTTDEDPRLGTGLLAFCELTDEATPASVLAACRAALPGYQVPRRIVRVDSIPRSPSGKIDRRAIDALASEA